MRNTIKRAYLTDVKLDEIITSHIKLVTTPKTTYEWDENEDMGFYGGDLPTPKQVVVREAKAAPRRAVLLHKYKYIIHEIIMRCRASKNNSVQMNYGRYVSVLGKDFGDMLYNLDKMDIICLGTTYTMGKSSRRISLIDWNIDFIEDANVKVLEYADRIKAKYLESLKKYSSNQSKSNFIKKYNQCLLRLELVDRSGALDYIESRIPSFKTRHSYYYYKSRIEDYNKKDLLISSIDNNGRIYHYLTNLPKSLKRFFNISSQLDIANSHPVLFSYFLIKEYNINNEIIKNIININYKDIVEYHNKGKQLRKLLKNNNIEMPDSKSLPNDVLYYVYATMKGKFWNEFVEVFKTMNRGEVKSTLFREVFYSHSTTTRNKDYAKKFAEIYPNVWHSIRMMKKKSRGNLPNQMMSFESKLFGAILRRCYAKGWCVVSIHDAIIVLNVPENEQLDIDVLCGIMTDEYSKVGLFPTIAIESYIKKQPQI